MGSTVESPLPYNMPIGSIQIRYRVRLVLSAVLSAVLDLCFGPVIASSQQTGQCMAYIFPV